jgi:hypothetical protein
LRRLAHLAGAALVALAILAPSAAVAQDAIPGDDDPFSPEPNVVVLEQDQLEKAVGKRLPQQVPDEPIDEPGGAAPKSGTLPKSGGLAPSSLLLPAAALILGSGVLVLQL